eukprot:5938115-Pyramimonas_sp.AAC.1
MRWSTSRGRDLCIPCEEVPREGAVQMGCQEGSGGSRSCCCKGGESHGHIVSLKTVPCRTGCESRDGHVN